MPRPALPAAAAFRGIDALMGKKLNTLIFILAGTVVDLLLIFAAVALLLALAYVCRAAIPEDAMPLMLFAAAIGGFIVGMIIWQRLAIWVIKKLKLEDRLDPIFKPRPPRKM